MVQNRFQGGGRKEFSGSYERVVMNGLGFNKAGGTGQKRRLGVGMIKNKVDGLRFSGS